MFIGSELLMKALEICVSPRVYNIHKFIPFEKVRIYGDISPDRSRHPFSEKFALRHTDFCVIFGHSCWES